VAIALLALLVAFLFMLWRRRQARRGIVSMADPVLMTRFLIARAASSGRPGVMPGSRAGRFLGRL
jgi:hypothetical protein